MDWYLKVLKYYLGFSGRARRKEYWMFILFILFNLLVSIGLMIVDSVTGTFDAASGWGLLSGIYTLAVLIPSLAVSARRLHDRDKSGWWLSLLLIPLVMEGDSGNNRLARTPRPMRAVCRRWRKRRGRKNGAFWRRFFFCVDAPRRDAVAG